MRLRAKYRLVQFPLSPSRDHGAASQRNGDSVDAYLPGKITNEDRVVAPCPLNVQNVRSQIQVGW